MLEDLYIEKTSSKYASMMNAKWHSKAPIIVESNINRTKNHICYSIHLGEKTVGVCIWSSPVSRKIDQETVLEMRRFALSQEAPKNSASKSISLMVKDIKKQFPNVEKLISYQDTSVHFGTIYKASSWIPYEMPASNATWTNRNGRMQSQMNGRKIRWEFKIK